MFLELFPKIMVLVWTLVMPQIESAFVARPVAPVTQPAAAVTVAPGEVQEP